MSDIKGQSAPFSPQVESQQAFSQSQQSPQQYDWSDVVRQQNSRLIQNEERQKQLQQIRKQKYREILEQEINEKEVKKNINKDIKKQEYQEIEKNISIVDRYDQEKKKEKRLIERQIQEQNKQLTQEKKQHEKQVKNLQIEQTQNSYTINNLNLQKQTQDEIQQKIQRQKDFLKELENQKQQNQAIRKSQNNNLQQEDKIFLDQLSSQENQLRESNAISSISQNKPNVFQQIDQAYREKEQRMMQFENHHVNEGYQQQIQREKKMLDLIKQEKKQLQNQVDSIVNDQLEYKKQVQVYNNSNKNEERSQIDQNYVNFKNSEIQRKYNQRELYMRQNLINQQQQQLKGQIKERQKHMNENEIKINLDKLPESPIIPQSATNFNQERSSHQQNQTKSNLIYMGDYVSFDRQKQLQQVDKDLIEKLPAQQELYKRTVINQSTSSLPQLNDSIQNQFPKNFSPDQNQQAHSNRSNDLYLQQAKFPKNHAFTTYKSPPLLMNTQPLYQNNYPPKNLENNQQLSQTLDYNYRQSSSPQIKYSSNPPQLPNNQNVERNTQQNQQFFNQNNQQQNQFMNINQEQIKNINEQIEKPQQYQQQQNQQKRQSYPQNQNESIEKPQQQQQQQNQQKRQSYPQNQIFDQNISNQQQMNTKFNQNSNKRVQSQSQLKQVMSPNNYYQHFNYNIQSNSNLNNPPQHSQSTPQQIIQVPISNVQNELPNSRSNKKEFNIKSIQYNAPINDQIPVTSNKNVATENMIRVYRSPQHMQLSSNNQQQNYHIPQQNRNQIATNQSINQGVYSNHRSGANTGMSSSMNFMDHRTNILSSQRQDYNQIRQSNANWAQRGFNIITGAT